jgi:hypothetical protein
VEDLKVGTTSTWNVPDCSRPEKAIHASISRYRSNETEREYLKLILGGNYGNGETKISSKEESQKGVG